MTEGRDPFLPELNPEQREAVLHGEGPLLVLAGAGSGKTRVLTARAARLVGEEGIPPERLLMVTFTNKAAEEMRERIRELLGADPAGMWAGTFHSVAARLLRLEAEHAWRDRNFTIYDQDDSLRAVRRAMEDVGLDPERWSPRSIQSRISDAKSAMVAADEFRERSFDLVARRVAEVYPRYQDILRRSNALDFDDLLVHGVRLLEEVPAVAERYRRRFRHVLVDEYQDTNHAQYRMVRALGRAHGNVCVVGDDDQSIYGWRGADLRNILDFERDFEGARVVRLERNYRSTERILAVANAVIARNTERKEKTLRSVRDRGEPVRVVRVADERAEARWTVREIQALAGRHRPDDCAVLYRTNAQSRPYEDALREAGLPYRIVGGVRFYERREIKDVLAYLRLAANPADDAAFRRVVSWPRRGVGSVTLERLEAAREDGESLLGAAARATEVEELPTAGARSLEEFAGGIRELHEAGREATAEEVIRRCIGRFGLLSALESEEDGEDRIANVTELVAAAAEFDAADAEEAPEEATELGLYLQTVSLLGDRDQAEEGPGVTLMTLHNAKGLEFPVVFVGGVEEGLFPLSRALEGGEGIEEERRLFYVGVTRARDRLYLTHADRRWRAGSQSQAGPSRFLEEIPDGPVERRRGGALARNGRSGGGSPSAGRRGRSRRGSGGDGAGGSRFSWRRGGSPGRGAGGEGSEAAGSGSAGLGSDDGEATYDYGDSQVPLELEPGGRVVHPRFGEGTILATSGDGRSLKLTVDFDAAGEKKVMAAFADLRPA